MGVVSKSQIIEDEDFGLGQTSDLVEVAACSLGGLDLLEDEVDWEEDIGVAFVVRVLAVLSFLDSSLSSKRSLRNSRG